MATRALPPRSNIYALMLVVTTIAFAIGLIMNGLNLNEYNGTQAAAKPPTAEDALEALPKVRAFTPADVDDGADIHEELNLFDD